MTASRRSRRTWLAQRGAPAVEILYKRSVTSNRIGRAPRHAASPSIDGRHIACRARRLALPFHDTAALARPSPRLPRAPGRSHRNAGARSCSTARSRPACVPEDTSLPTTNSSPPTTRPSARATRPSYHSPAPDERHRARNGGPSRNDQHPHGRRPLGTGPQPTARDEALSATYTAKAPRRPRPRSPRRLKNAPSSSKPPPPTPSPATPPDAAASSAASPKPPPSPPSAPSRREPHRRPLSLRRHDIPRPKHRRRHPQRSRRRPRRRRRALTSLGAINAARSAAAER
jgi:hypothetical protein